MMAVTRPLGTTKDTPSRMERVSYPKWTLRNSTREVEVKASIKKKESRAASKGFPASRILDDKGCLLLQAASAF